MYSGRVDVRETRAAIAWPWLRDRGVTRTTFDNRKQKVRHPKLSVLVLPVTCRVPRARVVWPLG